MTLWTKLFVLCEILLLSHLCHAEVCNEKAAQRRHALLIGIADYPKAVASRTIVPPLKGPINDIMLVKHILKNKYCFTNENIIQLTNQDATHTNIESAFNTLAKKIQQGDFVYIHYSGHGSFVPNLNADNERTHVDQTWVPYGARSGRFSGINDFDILDDEINLWLQPLSRKTNHLVIVSDSCHSATVTRNSANILVRSIEQDHRFHPRANTITRSVENAQHVRIGAARDTESAVEDKIGAEQRHYGLFTWFWAQALESAKHNTTWRDIFQRTFTEVTTYKATKQRPQRSGMDNRLLFAGRFVEAKPTIAIKHVQGNHIRLNAGDVSGVTKGSVFRLKGAEIDHQPSLKITHVFDLISFGEVTNGQFEVGDLVVETLHAYRIKPLKLSVLAASKNADDLALYLKQGLAKLPGFKRINRHQDADIIIQAIAATTNAPAQAWMLTPLFEPIHNRLKIPLVPFREGLASIKNGLEKFARTRQIKGLKSKPTQLVALTLRVYILHPTADCQPHCVTPPIPGGATYRKSGPFPLDALPNSLAKNDLLTFDLSNPTTKDLYAYLLNITESSEVNVVFPPPTYYQDFAMIKAGETRDLSGVVLLQLDTQGLETLKMLATEKPIQINLFQMSGYRELTLRGSQLNPLEKLLMETGLRSGKERPQPLNWATYQINYEVK